MQKTNPAKPQSRRLPGKKMLLALSLACALAAGSASAQVLVTDSANISTNQSGFASQLAKTIDQYKQQIEQYAKQVQQYETQLQQYQQMLSSIQNLSNGLSLAPNQLQHITNTDSLIQGACSSSSGSGGLTGLVSSVMNSMTSLMSQSIRQSQLEICGQIVTTQVAKYNSTVDMLNNLNNYGSQFQQLDNLLQGNPTQADAERAAAQVEKYNSAVNTQMSNWQTSMNADDAIISTLQGQQSILGRVALNGSNTVLGNVVQAGAFAAAFQ